MLSPQQVLDLYFLETRAQLLEVAATLDRLGRSEGQSGPTADPRAQLLAGMIQILTDEKAGNDRARRILELHSEP